MKKSALTFAFVLAAMPLAFGASGGTSKTATHHTVTKTWSHATRRTHIHGAAGSANPEMMGAKRQSNAMVTHGRTGAASRSSIHRTEAR